MLEFFARSVDVILTLEDHVCEGGFGSAVLEELNNLGLTTPVVRIGWPDQFIEHGKLEALRAKYGITRGSGAGEASALRGADSGQDGTIRKQADSREPWLGYFCPMRAGRPHDGRQDAGALPVHGRSLVQRTLYCEAVNGRGTIPSAAGVWVAIHEIYPANP